MDMALISPSTIAMVRRGAVLSAHRRGMPAVAPFILLPVADIYRSRPLPKVRCRIADNWPSGPYKGQHSVCWPPGPIPAPQPQAVSVSADRPRLAA